MFANQVVIADVQLIQRLAQAGEDGRMAVAQIVEATVAVAVDQTFFAVHIPDVKGFALAGMKSNPAFLKKRALPEETCSL